METGGTPTFEERLKAVELEKANLVAEARAQLNEIAEARKELDTKEAKLRDFLGMDKAPSPPEPEKKAKAARGSVRGPVEAFYRANAQVLADDGSRVGYHVAVVAKETGLDPDQVGGAAAKLCKDGILVRVSKSSYRLAVATAV